MKRVVRSAPARSQQQVLLGTCTGWRPGRLEERGLEKVGKMAKMAKMAEMAKVVEMANLATGRRRERGEREGGQGLLFFLFLWGLIVSEV